MTLTKPHLHVFLALPAALAGCATQPPPPYAEVVTMKAADAASVAGYPPSATVWRLDEADLKKLSPAPFVEPPPPPRRPPPPPYYAPPPPFWWWY